jgi:thiamine-phosphate pyrophosphorylase
VLVGDSIWTDPRGPKAALIEADAAIKKAHATALAEQEHG